MTIRSFNPSQVHLYRPAADSHKGQNGKLLVIGGSKLFHSSIFWSADVASKIVDLVHFASPANENNEVVRKRIKEGFWSGIVVDWGEVEKYIEEDDCILIGPGMVRSDPNLRMHPNVPNQANSDNSDVHSDHSDRLEQLEKWARQDKTKEVVNYLLSEYPSKRWVIDGGALQEVEPELITQNCILTPHRKEFERLIKKVDKPSIGWGCEARMDWRPSVGVAKLVSADGSDRRNRITKPASQTQPLDDSDISLVTATASRYVHNATILLKGPIDVVCQGKKCVSIKGGNPGMTKGGAGDVLAGLVAALFCKNSAWTAATVGSYVNKKAGDELYKRVGPYFNADDLLNEIPKVMKEINS